MNWEPTIGWEPEEAGRDPMLDDPDIQVVQPTDLICEYSKEQGMGITEAIEVGRKAIAEKRELSVAAAIKAGFNEFAAAVSEMKP